MRLLAPTEVDPLAEISLTQSVPHEQLTLLNLCKFGGGSVLRHCLDNSELASTEWLLEESCRLSCAWQPKCWLSEPSPAHGAKDKSDTPETVHHSDRGVQYCSALYQKLQAKHGITCSMTDTWLPSKRQNRAY